MGDLDKLVERRGVLVAGRFGADWRIAELKSESLYFSTPASVEFVGWFCAAAHMMFGGMAFAASGLGVSSWLPQRGWTFSGGDFTIAMHGDQFVIVETEKVESIDELRRLLLEGQP